MQNDEGRRESGKESENMIERDGKGKGGYAGVINLLLVLSLFFKNHRIQKRQETDPIFYPSFIFLHLSMDTNSGLTSCT